MIKLLGLVLVFAGMISIANAGPLIDDHSVNADANAAAAASASASNTNSNVNAPVTVNTNTAKGGDASSRSSADSVNLNTNVNTAKGGSAFQGQDQHQRQSMSQGQSQGQSVDGSGNSHVSINNPRQPVNSAIAAALTASNETCMGSSTIGGQGVGFGLSIGSTWENEACERRRNASVLFGLGLPKAALALMCQDETVATAVASAGIYCPGNEPLRVSEAPAEVIQPATMQPIPN